MKSAKRKKGQAGLTLLEMMVVSSLISIFSIFMVNVLMITQNALALQKRGTPVRTEAKQAMEYMAKELREADLTAPGGIDVIPNTQITFKKPKQVTTWGISSWRCVQFDKVGTDIYRYESEDESCVDSNPDLIGRNVSSLQFNQITNNIIGVTVGTSLTDTNIAAPMQSTLTSQIKLRNGGS
jgi:prepilin-type N-terminal cleavage/methylation domain-containing protein